MFFDLTWFLCQAFGLMFGDLEDFVVSEWSFKDLVVSWEERYPFHVKQIIVDDIFFDHNSQLQLSGVNMGCSCLH